LVSIVIDLCKSLGCRNRVVDEASTPPKAATSEEGVN
jgi:hypothetical protein